MGRFKPGESGNPAGRPKGTKNKTPEELRKIISGVLTEYYTKGNLRSDLAKLDPRERVTAICKLTRHVIPPPIDDLIKLSDDDLNRLADKVKTKYFSDDEN